MPLEDFFDCIKQQYVDKLPFVVYRKPNETKVFSLLQNDNELFVTKDFKEAGFVFSPFDVSKDSVFMPLKSSKSFQTEFTLPFETYGLKNVSEASSEEKKNHISLVNKSIGVIEKGLLKKVVISRCEIIPIAKTDVIIILKRLLSLYKSAFVYCWYHPKVGLWLGATPETLIKIEGSRFSIMSLAATQVYKDTLQVDWQEKELNEQQFVTDYIVDNLKPCVDGLQVSEIQTVKAGNLLHLKTMITAQLKPEISSIKQVVSILHPTPAVCGLPQKEAKQFILDNEKYDRGFYTGFLGEINMEMEVVPKSSKRNIENRAYTIKRKSTQLYVNLRCMQIKGDNALIYVGGGITRTSNPEQEWQETVSKSLVIKSILD